MRVTYSGVIAASASDVWDRLIDIDTLLLLLPGATLQREGDRVVGSLRVRPTTQVTYKITAGASTAAEGDTAATIAVTGAEARGDGTLAATVVVAVRDEDGGSGLAATADVEATGRAAEADEHDWDRVLARLGNAVVASFERHPPGTPVPRPDPEPVAAAPEPAAEAPAPSDPEPQATESEPPRVTSVSSPGASMAAAQSSKAPLIVGGIVVLLLLRWLLKRRG